MIIMKTFSEWPGVLLHHQSEMSCSELFRFSTNCLMAGAGQLFFHQFIIRHNYTSVPFIFVRSCESFQIKFFLVLTHCTVRTLPGGIMSHTPPASPCPPARPSPPADRIRAFPELGPLPLSSQKLSNSCLPSSQLAMQSSPSTGPSISSHHNCINPKSEQHSQPRNTSSQMHIVEYGSLSDLIKPRSEPNEVSPFRVLRFVNKNYLLIES